MMKKFRVYATMIGKLKASMNKGIAKRIEIENEEK